MEKIAVYPGSFDPITNGHLSLVKRGLKIFDAVIIGVASNPEKKPLFTLEERLEMASKSVEHYPNITVKGFGGLLVEFVESCGSNVILKGLRAVSDFEYEFQLALMNRRLNRNIQSVFLMTDYRWLYLSSTIVKEAARLRGSIEGLVPRIVEERLREKFGVGVS
jgi:pantetheine-phosphate adenylyltransferase